MKIALYAAYAAIGLASFAVIPTPRSAAQQKPDNASNGAQTKCQTALALPHKVDTSEKAHSAQNCTPEWYATVQWSNWVLAIVASVTAWYVAKQARQTKKAARAALLNAQALIDAERPWIVVKPEFSDQIEGQVYFRATNIGRTPAQIVSNNMELLFIEAPDNEFPNPAAWNEPQTFPAMLAPNDSFFVNNLPYSPENRVKYRKPLPSVAGHLCFCGRIQYRDVLIAGSTFVLHESCWCYSYSPTPVLDQRFFNCGPERYNHYT